ncbi:hypothetical protein D9M68_939090 [compost metagenome]
MAQAPDHPARQLCFEVHGVQHLAHFGDHEGFVDTDALRGGRDLHHLGHGYAERQGEGESAPTSLGQWRAPACQFSHCLEHAPGRLV